jgi:RNA polymerase sigma-70 factor (ECF subfamily)
MSLKEQKVASRKQLLENKLIVLRCRRGEEPAFEELIDRWERPLFYYIRRLVDSEEEAWDVLQDTWLSVIRGIRQLREPAALPAWLYRIARNTAVSHLRKTPRFESLSTDEGEEDVPDDTPNVAVSELQAEDVHRALRTLSLPHREVLTLRFLEDFSLAEIGEITGAPLGTVKSRLFHAKRALREAVETGGGKR